MASGCGGDGESQAGEDSSGDDGVIVAALGDSITAGSPLWDPDPDVRERILAPEESSQYEYWAAERSPELSFRNCGVFGERTDEIARRLEECAEGADMLVVQGGINDIAQGRPVEDAAADLRSTVEAGKEMGLTVLLANVLPWNNGGPAFKQPIAELNRRIERIGRAEDVAVLPFHDTLEDPREQGVMAPALTEDGDHPSVEGYRRLGTRAFPELATLTRERRFPELATLTRE